MNKCWIYLFLSLTLIFMYWCVKIFLMVSWYLLLYCVVDNFQNTTWPCTLWVTNAQRLSQYLLMPLLSLTFVTYLSDQRPWPQYGQHPTICLKQWYYQNLAENTIYSAANVTLFYARIWCTLWSKSTGLLSTQINFHFLHY